LVKKRKTKNQCDVELEEIKEYAVEDADVTCNSRKYSP
jgi:hypothetical protein